MKTSDFDYFLPKELIAQTPVEPRDHSRLLLVNRESGDILDGYFYDLPNHIRKGDVLVFNDSRVVPARLYGKLKDSENAIELLLLSRLKQGNWRALVKPGRRMKTGAKFVIGQDTRKIVLGEILEEEKSGARIVNLEGEENINDVGVLPLPPYIRERVPDAERYQTIYSKEEGSIAAPTAGLHFTGRLMKRLQEKGAEIVFVTLHVGWDSFRPLTSENPLKHQMHSEYWDLPEKSAQAINLAKREGRRVISIGTTATRLLENVALDQAGPPIHGGDGWADIFITPGHSFRILDGLVTNFHLPRSTLLMLTSAIAGKELLQHAYKHAVRANYRFYSFGDAMFIT